MYTYCRAFGSGAVTTRFYDLGLSRLGFEHPIFRLQGKRSNRLRRFGCSEESISYDMGLLNMARCWDFMQGL